MLLVTANALIRREQVTLLGYEPAAAEALAGRVVVFIVSMHVVNTLFYQWISRWWPVRASQPFARYFAFSCYMMAIYLPMAALEVLLDPIVFMLVASNKASQLLLFLPLAIGGAVGFVIFWIYTNPGMAYINGVSATRMALATMLWTTSIFFTGGMLVGVLLTLMRG